MHLADRRENVPPQAIIQSNLVRDLEVILRPEGGIDPTRAEPRDVDGAGTCIDGAEHIGGIGRSRC